MELENKIEEKFRNLIGEGDRLKRGGEYGQVINSDHAFSCKGWLASAQNLVHLVVTNSENPYRASVDRICALERGFCIHESVGEITVILQSLLADIRNGLLASVENQAKALVFDDFLDHAKYYVRKAMKNEGGVIAGVVFEDSLRNICRNKKITESGVSLDQLINELTKREILSQVKAKRAKVASHVRTKATHAQWEEFELSDVKTTIEFTEELISINLA